MATSTRPPYTKLTYLLSSYYRREGTTSLPRWRRGTIPHARDTLRLLEGFGYKSSLMNWKPGILKMELRDKEQV